MIEYGVAGEGVDLVLVDHGFSLGLEKGLRLRVDADFDYADTAGVVHRITPSGDPTSCRPALALVRASVASMRVTDDWQLQVRFTDSSRITVDPLVRGVAWETVEENGTRVGCGPRPTAVRASPRSG